MVELSVGQLHPSLDDPVLHSMNLLNDIAADHPRAVSFAAGRPYEEFFRVEQLHEYLETFFAHLTEVVGLTDKEARRTVFQYGRTKGVIHDLVARYLEIDEAITVDPDSVVVTVGSQEAMFLTLRSLRASPRDVVLAVAPTYFGLTGAARLLDMPVLPVGDADGGLDLADLERQVAAARARGQRPRALYLVPDFSNPTGVSLDQATRIALLDLAAELDLLIIEDNPYGLFQADPGTRPSTLKALDTRHQVVHIGSFAKTGLPGARVGFVVADQPVTRDGRPAGTLADQLSLIKSNVTLNTSPVAQAVVGGKLLRHGCSMVAANKREIEVYRANLRRVLAGLTWRFAATGPVTWNTPAGGFFVVLTVPFTVDDRSLRRSARDHGVIWTPLHHFHTGMTSSHQIRLSFSLLDNAAIDEGLDRLAAFVRAEIQAAPGRST
ncbi:aminotransferase-like domain-containing protein [Streptomyces corynorhini]|uniref:PLP-dependent aminotransferase family protein n=1 Tax=Streptomyces corynorhini TaxID=2282652 RepID=A0A370B1R4_9ACTN|nr:PLP-dependent aminotransferase family protein [Streptomyces corynorhini]RDG35541.1 PLP-dependent aminotransferase family protein [Streptomyces corynorhini]